MDQEQRLKSLTSPGWEPRLRKRLTQLLTELGKNCSHHCPDKPPYAVFDWDNTCIFADVDEAVLLWQLTHGTFAASLEQFTDFLQVALDQLGDSGLAALAEDLTVSYPFLFDEGALREQHRQVFQAKFLAFLQRLEQQGGKEFAYPWIARRFVGYSAEQVRTMALKAVSWQLQQPMVTQVFQSPPELPGRAGPVEVSWRSGLRLIPEMQELFRCLREAGIEVWVCTASLAEEIRGVTEHPNFGYHLPAERVLGMELEVDGSGRYLSRLHPDYEVTYKEGKTEAIRRRLVAHYACGPVLVAGDSDGDASMLQAFVDTHVSLIIDLGQPPDTPIGRLLQLAERERNQPRARYWAQKRDENEGRFVP